MPGVLRAIAGAQAQEPRSGRLQVRVRSSGLTADDVERARVEDRTIIRHWVMRMTAHLFPTEDLAWMAPLFSERMAAWSRRRLEVLGVPEKERERALKAIRRRLDSDGEMTRAEAMATAERTGLEVDVQRRTHLSVLTVVEGGACIGPTRGKDNLFVATREWIGEQRPVDPERGLEELARRYVSAFAPATERDFAAWSGLPLGQCRAGLAAIADEMREVKLASGDAALAPKGWRARAPRSPAVRLLGAYDTYLMGYENRRHAVERERRKAGPSRRRRPAADDLRRRPICRNVDLEEGG